MRVLVGSGAVPDAPDLRTRLVAAAEQLFFERGLDGVSLREINAAAGARNASAVQYHLGGRDGVIAAVLEKHAPEVEARRHALLDAAQDEPELRAVVAAYVRPLAVKLGDADGGPGYLQVLADLATAPGERALRLLGGAESDSTARWRTAVAPFMPAGAVELHRRFTAMQFTHVELARRAHERGVRADHRLFTSHLVDLVAGLLGAPVSGETARLVEARDARRAARTERS